MNSKITQVDPLPAISLGSVLGARKSALLEKFRTDTLLYYKSRVFRANGATIGFVNALIMCGQTSAVLLDTSDVPVMVDSLEDLRDKLVELYTAGANSYLTKMTDARNLRTVKAAIERG